MVFMKTDMLQVVLLQMSETTCHASVWQSEEFSSFQDFFFFFSFLWNDHFKLAITPDPLTLDLVLLALIHHK